MKSIMRDMVKQEIIDFLTGQQRPIEIHEITDRCYEVFAIDPSDTAMALSDLIRNYKIKLGKVRKRSWVKGRIRSHNVSAYRLVVRDERGCELPPCWNSSYCVDDTKDKPQGEVQRPKAEKVARDHWQGGQKRDGEGRAHNGGWAGVAGDPGLQATGGGVQCR